MDPWLCSSLTSSFIASLHLLHSEFEWNAHLKPHNLNKASASSHFNELNHLMPASTWLSINTNWGNWGRWNLNGAHGLQSCQWPEANAPGSIVSGIIKRFVTPRLSHLPPLLCRYMLGLSVLPAVLQFIGFLFLPESPRWLIQHGLTQKARRVLSQIRGNQNIDEEYDSIKNSIDEEDSGGGNGGEREGGLGQESATHTYFNGCSPLIVIVCDIRV